MSASILRNSIDMPVMQSNKFELVINMKTAKAREFLRRSGQRGGGDGIQRTLDYGALVASLIGRLGSSTFRLSTAAVSMSLTGSRFSSESAPGPFHHGIRGRGGTIYWAALPSNERQVQATKRTHLIHRPARDIFPPQGGTRVSSYRI